MVNEVKGKESWRAIVPEAVTAEVFSNQLKQVSARITRLEAQAEIEVRGVSAIKAIPTGSQPNYDYREKGWDMPSATGHKLIPLKDGVDAHSWSMIPQLPSGASTAGGHKPQAKELQVIGATTSGKQVRWTETIQPENRGVAQGTVTTRPGAPLREIYQKLIVEADPLRPQGAAVPTEYTGPGEATRGGIVSLQDSVRDLTGTLRRLIKK